MKKHLLILALLGVTHVSRAQDQLFKKDNSKLLVKITEVSPEEIKYKLHSNLTGPTYVVNKNEVSLVIYENGQHEVISTSPAPTTVVYQQGSAAPYSRPSGTGMSKADSSRYYKYSESISMNFFSFLNTEVGLIYQKDFFKSNFNIIIPLAIGLDKPTITESVYFNNGNNGLTLDRKLFEVGFGVNYYPSLRFPVNYYVGPTFRYMQYGSQQTYSFRDPSLPQAPYYYGNNVTIEKRGTLSRYCMTVTNGLIFRTKSRLMLNLFASIGFKNDILSDKIVDPVTHNEVNPIRSSFNLYFWTGFSVGFCF